MNTLNEIMALSCQLDTLSEFDFDNYIAEVEMNSADMMSYNSSYYVDGKRLNDPYRDESFFSVADSIGKWQVFRTFQLRFYRPTFMSYQRNSVCEVAQEWISEDGYHIMLMKRYWNKNYNMFNFKSSFRVVTELPNFFENNYSIIDEPNILFKSINPNLYMKVVEYYNNPSIEENCSNDTKKLVKFVTGECGEFLFKCGYKDTFEYLINNKCYYNMDNMAKYLPSIKIAHRHHYKFDKDLSIWLDTLSFIDFCHGDTRQPKFICPENLLEVHNLWMKRKQKEIKRVKLEEDRLKALNDEEFYNNTHNAFFGIVFGSDINHLQFHVIQSASEMIEEGRTMHHCVGGYTRMKDSLIISCRDEHNNRVATIEVNLNTFTIVQTRGLSNAVPEHFDEINETINKNMELFKIAKAGTKKHSNKMAA